MDGGTTKNYGAPANVEQRRGYIERERVAKRVEKNGERERERKKGRRVKELLPVSLSVCLSFGGEFILVVLVPLVSRSRDPLVLIT